MARKKPPSSRIEPNFDAASSSTVPEPEPIMQPAPKKAAKKQTEPKKVVKKQPEKKSKLGRLFKFMIRPLPFLTYWGLVLGLWAGIFVAGIFVYYGAKLPNAQSWSVPERPPNMRIVATDGSLIENRGLTGGKALRLEDMSPYIAQAVIAIEDRRFHSHFGFDPIGFTRAMTRNIMSGRMREGGSTLTQQLAKNLFLKPERTFGRKVQELILAVWLETKYSKADILELYLNRVYFGAGATGVDAASQRYFGKSAKHVTISEAALIAGLLKAPSRYTPAKNPKLAQARAKTVLRAMQREGYIKTGEIDINSVTPGKNAVHFRSGPEHFIADYVAKHARKILGEVRTDVVIETTIDPFLMTAAHSILKTNLDKYGEKRRVSQAALLSLAPDGAVRAMIGGRNYSKSQFNRAVEAKRQPGSAFKTFVWLNALERGDSPQSVYLDEPVQFGKWKPVNYDRKYRGPIKLIEALSKSVNTIAAKLAVEAGPKNIAHTAHRMGISSQLTANASLALGTSEVTLLELTAAYAPFANGGMFVRPYIITRITDNKGKTLFQRDKDVPMQVVEGRELSMMNTMLKRVIDKGTGKNARLKNRPAGGKTGTTQNSRDALFIGYTADLVTGIWYGNDDNKPTKKLTGGSLPAKSWKDFMTIAHADLPIKPLPGEYDYLANLPEKIPSPKFRPYDPSVTTAGVKTKSDTPLQKAKKSILNLLTGN